jgi:hypothetical protein
MENTPCPLSLYSTVYAPNTQIAFAVQPPNREGATYQNAPNIVSIDCLP